MNVVYRGQVYRVETELEVRALALWLQRAA